MEAKIVIDRVSDKSKGFGFFTYASVDETEKAKAIAEMDGKLRGLGSMLFNLNCSRELRHQQGPWLFVGWVDDDAIRQ
ncbi:hypothetical protein CRYUN_Cryun05aG0215900 [Craigia yunnanensis]